MKTIYSFIALVVFPAFLIAQKSQVMKDTEGYQTSHYIQANGINFIENNLNEALKQAQSTQKLIFVDAYTTWCGPCKMMAKTVFPDANVSALYNTRFINLKMDMEKGEGIAMAKRYDVTAFPTLLFLDGDGQIVHKALGFHDINDFIELGKTALDSDQSLSAWTKKYDKGNREAAFLKEYALKLAAAYDSRRSDVGEEYLKTQKDWTTDDNLDFIYRLTEKANSKFFDYFIQNRSAFEKKYSPSEIEAKTQSLLSDALFDDKNIPTLGFVDSLLQKVYGKESVRMSKKYRLNYYRMKGDREKYAESAIAYLKKYNDSAEELGDIAALFYEQIADRKMLKKAVSWAKKAIAKDNSYYNNLTLANLYNSLDKKSNAKKAALRAIDIAKKNGETFDEAQELFDSIKQ